MNVEIARLAITLQGGSTALGEGVSEAVEGAVRQALSTAALRSLAGAERLDLGALDVPTSARNDPRAIAAWIAARLAAQLGEGT